VDTRNAELRTTTRDEERRRRDEVLANSLQQQIDELRAQVREQATRQQRLEEIARAGEGQVGQVRLELTELRQETNRWQQLRQLDDQRQRQLVTDLQARVEEPLRPLRTLQAQVNDLGEQVRQSRDHDGQVVKQLDGLRMQIEAQRADTTRALETARQTREVLEAVQTAQAALGRDSQKIADQVRLVEQEARRRVATIEQQLDNLGRRIDEVAAHHPQVDEGIRQLRDDLRIFQPQIDALAQRDKQQDQHTARIQTQAEERDALMRQRVEEIREHLANETSALSTVVSDSVKALHVRIGEWEAAQRDVAALVSDLEVSTSALAQRDEALAEAQLRSEERLVRSQLEQAQAAWETLLERRQKDES
jgi:chromosome segregation ATPase